MTIATSDFNQADSTTVGPGTFTEVTGNWETLSNQLHLVSVGSTSRLRFESDTGSSDMYCQATGVDLILTSDTFMAVCARFDAAASTFYYFGVEKTPGTFAAGSYTLGKSIAGATTVLVASTANAFTNGSSIKILCQGSTIQGYIGGSLKTSITDTSITTGSLGGIRGYRDVAGDDFHIDNLEVGSIVSNASWSPRPHTRFAPFKPGAPR
jgi:hypothetical protein